MKTLSTILIALFSLTLFASDKTIEIGAFQTVELNYEEFALYNVKIKNSSDKQIKVTVNEIETDKQVKGFGLPGRNHAIVAVEEGRVLKLKNSSAKKLTIHLNFVDKPKPKTEATGNTQYIRFTLRNSSAQNIPLVIPNVMNPNLSAFSNSAVSLKVGQEILFKYKGNTRVLFVVTEDFEEGSKVEVSSILKRRKKEIDQK